MELITTLALQHWPEIAAIVLPFVAELISRKWPGAKPISKKVVEFLDKYIEDKKKK